MKLPLHLETMSTVTTVKRMTTTIHMISTTIIGLPSAVERRSNTILQQRFKEYIGNKGPVKTHFENCAITPTHDVVSILGSMDRGEGRLLTLET